MFSDEKKRLLQLLNVYFDLFYQQDTQLMVAGNNGPYDQRESPLRTTAHWLIILSQLADLNISHDIQLDRIKRLYAGIKAYHKADLKNFISRLDDTAKVDAVNGTIGAAWIFEGFAHSFNIVPDDDLFNICRQIYDNHYFNSRLGLWHRNFIDGSKGRIDQTFNHQLWMAYGSAVLFKDDKEVMSDVNYFMDNLSKNMGQYAEGLIYHPMPYKADIRSKTSAIIKSVRSVVDIFREKSMQRLHNIRYERDMYLKSIGYHAFNLFALAGLHTLLPKHSFFSSKSFRTAVRFIATDEYRVGLELENHFGYKYNLSGFECLSVLNRFSDFYSEPEKKDVAKVVAMQFTLFDMENREQSYDANTYVASCYKALIT